MPARKHVSRQRKHKVLAREKGKQKADQHDDSNAVEYIPNAKEQDNAKRKAQLRQELTSNVQVSGKKAKRLDKYIENKLKKDENRALLAALAKTKVDTSLFSSTKNLGQGKETRRQRLSRALKEKEAGLDDHDEELLEERAEAASESDSDSDSADLRKGAEAASTNSKSPVTQTTSQPALASGLKRPLEIDDDGRPVIPKRQKRRGVKSTTVRLPAASIASALEELEESGSGWEGCSGNREDESEPNGDALSADDSSSSEAEDDGGSDDSDSDGGGDSDSDDSDTGTEQKVSNFKAWAHQRRNEALGYKPVDSNPALLEIPRPKDFQPRPLEQDPLPQELQPTADNSRVAHSVVVSRPPEIQEARLNLPVVAEEQRIMEAIHNNDAVIICGSTGSGKTTQVPQFLFEAGYGSLGSPTPGLIGVTQPRKVAAVSMSKRVAQELGDHADKVAYQIRFEGNSDSKTAIKFMTDGVLLRELSNDLTLSQYSIIVLDEAHERSVNTDILIGMLSRVTQGRRALADRDPTVKPLKIVIMSATLRTDDWTKNPRLFSSPPPVLDVEGRQFPVTVHFARRTGHDYVEEAFNKIKKGHRKLPPGGFLVFLTGYDEISRLSRMLREESGGLGPASYSKARISAHDAPLEAEDIDFGQNDNPTKDDFDEVESISDGEDPGDDDENEDAEFNIPDEEAGTGPLKMHILPLYSLLPTKDQMRVFDTQPENSRKIIIATNIAETSLTIPGTRYVFDCGRSKERRFNKETGVQSYEVGWISKASANQRSGRAGRTGPGHCYRLYSSAVYERDFEEFSEPEILRMPIENVVLQIKAMGLPQVARFPFPTPPDRQMIIKAEKTLRYLTAIDENNKVTPTGSMMAEFPLSPRLSRILLIGNLRGCIHYAIALIAALSADPIFIPENQAIPTISDQDGAAFRTNGNVISETKEQQWRNKFRDVHRTFCSLDNFSDAMKFLHVVGDFIFEPTALWCEKHFVRLKPLQEAQKLRKQLANLLQKDIPAHIHLVYEDQLPRPTLEQVSALKQMIAAGFIDQVAIRGDIAPKPPEMHRAPRRAIDVPYLPLHPVKDGPVESDVERCVFIHPTSALAHLSPQKCPEYIVYSQLQQGVPTTDSPVPKVRMLALTNVTGAQLALLAKDTPLLTYGKPIKEVKGAHPLERECWVVPELRAEHTGGQGWPLPVQKIKQKKVPGKGWVAVQ